MAELVLALESSCDETAAAVVAGGVTVLSSVVSSQVDLHARYGGVVPELAGRAHLERLLPVVSAALADAGLGPGDGPKLAAVAATVGPGLIGSLLVGVSAAKALALAWGVPFVGVNHLEGHLYASLLEAPELARPAVVLLVSGGHTLLVALEAPGRYRMLGGTLDDAAGEAFDKVARYLGLGYPGGPAVQHAAADGDPAALALPRPMRDEGLDFSFSGLKTAVVTGVRAQPHCPTPDVAASFQEAVVDVLVHKAMAAAAAIGARAVCLAGGVGANGPLRARLSAAAAAAGLSVYLPSLAMCTDNAAMIAAAAAARLAGSGPDGLETGAQPNLRFPGA
jgi:N6-L-threonylcarbamoyladenine synthase